MALSVHGVSSAIAAGTTSVAVAYPTVSAADALFCFASCKSESSDPQINDDSWDDFGAQAGGAGSAGADSGQVNQHFFYKNAVGTETGTKSVTVSGANAALGCMVSVSSNAAGKMALCPFLSNAAADNTAGTGYSTSHSLSVGFVAAGDVIVVCVTTNTDANTYSAHSLSVPGCTISSASVQKVGGTANGNDMYMVVCTFTCTAGSSNGSAATFSMTASGSAGNQNAGVTHLCVAREVDATPHNVLAGNKPIVGELWDSTPSGSPLQWSNNDGYSTDTLTRTAGSPAATTTPAGAPALSLAVANSSLSATNTWTSAGNSPSEILIFADVFVPSLAASTNGFQFNINGGSGGAPPYIDLLLYQGSSGGPRLNLGIANSGESSIWSLDGPISAGWHSVICKIAATGGASKILVDGVDSSATYDLLAGSHFVPDFSSGAYTEIDILGAANDSGKLASLGVANTNSFYGPFADWQLTKLDEYQAALLLAPTVNGTLSGTTANASVSSAAQTIVKGTSAPTLAAATVSTAAQAIVKGSSAPTLADATASSAGTVKDNGAAAITLAAATPTATGAVLVVASATATLDAATISATGLASKTDGAAAITLGAATVSSAGNLPVVGAVTATLANATPTVTATVLVQATVQAGALDAATVSATGLASKADGELAVTLADATVSTTAQAIIKGSASATLSDSFASSGTVLVRGSANQVLDDATPTATGTVKVVASLAATLEDATLFARTLPAVVDVDPVAITLDDATPTAAGAVKVFGSVSVLLDGAASSATGTVLTHGAASVTTADATSSTTATVLVTGAGAIALDGAAPTVTGAVRNNGGLDDVDHGTTADATVSSGGTVKVSASTSATLDDASGTAAGTVKVSASATLTLDAASVSATGERAVKGTLNITLEDATVTTTNTGTAGVAVTLDAAVVRSQGWTHQALPPTARRVLVRVLTVTSGSAVILQPAVPGTAVLLDD